ncbi:MAG: hypothetical protein IAI50_07550, partial [Candidatus Eremiobacteraeota bacterium]|nr:hypothetical protein [Candidatus Eremiobacteraeota bacterium]
LSVPNDPTVTRLSAADLQRYEATRMFIERASAANDRFSIVDDDAAAITEICRRLDGIPLAIELASARIATLTVRQLHERLDDRFRILTGSGRTSIGRHRTLRALIDWSHDLLDEKERTLFRRLGTFVHGFTLDGAVAVAAGEVDESGVFDALASLVDKSLVLAEAAGDALRYRLLESTRLYACEKLAIAGEQKLAASRHLRFLRDRFAALRAEAERIGRRVEINRAFSSELDNVRSVLDTASESSELLVAAELLAHMRDNWRFLDLRHEGMKRTERMLELLPDSESQLIALLAGSLSRLLYENGNNVRAFDVTNHALAHARASGDIETIALILCYHSYAAIADRKLDVAEVSLAEAEAYTGTSVGLDLRLLRGRATLQYVRGEIDSAIRTGEMLLRKCRSVGETDGGRQAALNLARYEFARGRTQRAREIATVNLVACRVDSDWILPHTLLILAVCLAYEGDLAGAAASAGEATRLWADVEPDEPTTAAAILVRAFIFALRSHFVQAAMLAGYAASVFARYGSTLDAYEAMVQSRLTGILRAGLPIELERLLAEGASLAPDAAIALALGEA